MSRPYVTDLDFSSIVFSKIQVEKDSKKVELSRQEGGKIQFVLGSAPLRARYAIDKPQNDPTRRGQSIIIEDPDVIAALDSFDEAVMKHAVANCDEWFKNLPAKDVVSDEVREQIVRSRYSKLLQTKGEDRVLKFKIKVGGQVPTEMYERRADGTVNPDEEGAVTVADLEKSGCLFEPMLVCRYGIWFMGGGDSYGVSLEAEKVIVTKGKDRDPLGSFPYEIKRSAGVDYRRLDGTVDADPVADGESAM